MSRNGDLLAVEARRADDVRHVTATPIFGPAEPGDSLDPRGLGAHFNRLEWEENTPVITVEWASKPARYQLRRLEN